MVVLRAIESGMDVARKAVILAREAGLPLELADIDVENLVPDVLADTSVEAFLDQLSQFDATMAERVERAAADDQVLRYVAEIDFKTGTARVRLGRYAADHPFANKSHGQHRPIRDPALL